MVPFSPAFFFSEFDKTPQVPSVLTGIRYAFRDKHYVSKIIIGGGSAMLPSV